MRKFLLALPIVLLVVPGCRTAPEAVVAAEGVSTPGAASPTSTPDVPARQAAGAAPVSAAELSATPPEVAAPTGVALAAPPATAALAAAPAASATPAALGHARGAALGSAGGAPAMARPYAPAPKDEGRSADGAWMAAGGSIKAGEWDDNANYHEFQRYLAGATESYPLHRVDVSDRQFLVVRDMDGKAVPRCRVTVSDKGQQEVTLTTTASGRAVLFPHGERLDGPGLTASANCAGATASAHFSLADQDGIVDLRLQSKRELPATRTIDVAFILDTTGSMSEEITAVKSTIGKVAATLRQANFSVRIGLVEYKDRGDPFVTKVHPMSQNVDRFLADVSSIEAGGGGDTPESVNEGIHAALTQLSWGADSIGKFAFLIGDAPPHLDYSNDADYAVDMRDAAHHGIQVFTIAASGMDGLGQGVWRQIAQYTDATNLFVMRGGAGPQSVGGGDPRSSCGGTQTQYASGNLDVLIVSKVQHELKGLDRDPMRIPGLHGDENAKACGDRVAFD